MGWCRLSDGFRFRGKGRWQSAGRHVALKGLRRMMIGYARVFTEAHNFDLEPQALGAPGWERVFEDTASLKEAIDSDSTLRSWRRALSAVRFRLPRAGTRCGVIGAGHLLRHAAERTAIMEAADRRVLQAFDYSGRSAVRGQVHIGRAPPPVRRSTRRAARSASPCRAPPTRRRRRRTPRARPSYASVFQRLSWSRVLAMQRYDLPNRRVSPHRPDHHLALEISRLSPVSHRLSVGTHLGYCPNLPDHFTMKSGRARDSD